MRNAAFSRLFELAKEDPRILFVASDISKETVEDFYREIPDQILMEGIAEGHMIGMASGLAREGSVVFVNTIASFLTRRALDQIYVNVCLDAVNVKLLAQGGGLVYGRHGPTHHANEDVALMRTLPRMKVLVPCDVEQTRQMVAWAAKEDGPVYIRLSKGNGPVVSLGQPEFSPERILRFRSPGKVLLVTMGTMTAVALELSKALAESCVLSFPVLKPFPTGELLRNLEGVNHLVVVEEHVESGGLTTCVCEALLKENVRPLPKLSSFHLGDRFIGGYGRQEELWAENGLDAASLLKKLKEELE
jgi:transketolase